MATSEIKEMIHNIIDTISDDTLKELFPLLKDIQNNASDSKRIEIAKKIIADNRQLLQKLAQ